MTARRFAILRPEDPALALRLTEEWKAKHSDRNTARVPPQEEFNAILAAQKYTFVGFMSDDGKKLVDENGVEVGELKVGDSLVGAEALAKFQNGEKG